MPHGVEPPRGGGGLPERAGLEWSYVDGHDDGSKVNVTLPQSIRNRRTLDATKNGLLDTDQHNLIWIEDLTRSVSYAATSPASRLRPGERGESGINGLRPLSQACFHRVH